MFIPVGITGPAPVIEQNFIKSILNKRAMKFLLATLMSFSSMLLIAQAQVSKNIDLTVFAECDYQWTGIAISKKDRVFVNFPRWTENTPVSVGEIKNGKIVPFPDQKWNNWKPSSTVNQQFICVQSVYIDNEDRLWVLDTGYELAGDSTKGSYLYCFDLVKNTFIEEYSFPAEAISGKSYLNDFRIDHRNKLVYLTDSRVGGIVVLNLKTKLISRILSRHPSALSEVDKIVIEGYERRHPVHSDGIELDSGEGYLYYCALMGENIYRIPVETLLNKNLSDEALGKQVQRFAKTGANDGLILDKRGNLYLSSLEKNAISKLSPDGILETVVSDHNIKWPDSFAFDSKGFLYFTISQIHIPREKRGSYKIFKIKIE